MKEVRVAHQQRRLAKKEEISCARAMYQSTDLEIDSDARVSDAADHLWVQAWVYLPLDINGIGGTTLIRAYCDRSATSIRTTFPTGYE
jgi:hypothetical protein